jgi:hypothetical protein
MTADGVRCLSTDAREVEELVGHCVVGSDKRRACGTPKKIAGRVRLYGNKVTIVGWLKNGRQPLAICVLSTLDQIVICRLNV